MDELVSFLKSLGTPIWAIVGIVIVVTLLKPLSWLIGYVHRRPTLDEMMTKRFAEMGSQQGAFFDRLERQAKEAHAEAREARDDARQAREEGRLCHDQHEECRRNVDELRAELSRISGVQELNTEFRRQSTGESP